MLYKLVQFWDLYSWFVQIYVINCLIHYIIDISFYDISQKYKLIPLKKNVIQLLYRKYFTNVFDNVVISPLFGIIGVFIVNLDSLYESDFNLSECILELCMLVISADIFFYITHRIMHLPYFYKYHKKHHEVTIPISISALYVDSFDSFFNNTLPFIIPSFFICSNYLTIKIWVLLIVSESILSHSGYKGWGAIHNKHHTHYNVNYGNNIFMDKLFRTYA